MTTCLRMSRSFGFPCVSIVTVYQFVCVISILVLRVGLIILDPIFYLR